MIQFWIIFNSLVVKGLNNHKHMPVRDVFDLFDTLVKPIVLFNSKIWGININKELEQFHLSFMKRILGV